MKNAAIEAGLAETITALRYFADTRNNRGIYAEAMPGHVVGSTALEHYLWAYLYKAADALEATQSTERDARAKAIEECGKVVDRYVADKLAAPDIAYEIRMLKEPAHE